MKGTLITIYIQDGDLPTWERAQEFAKANGSGMGPIIIRLLTEFLDKLPQCECGAVMLPQWKHCPHCGKKAVKA